MATYDLDLLKTEIVESLKNRLGKEPSFDKTIIEDMVEDAIEEIKKARHYPKNYEDSRVVEDLYNYKSQIKKLCLYDFNRDGADGQNIHSENNIYRSYEDRKKCFLGVLPISNF